MDKTGRLIVEVNQYDDICSCAMDEVTCFDISSWDADQMKRFWEFLHQN